MTAHAQERAAAASEPAAGRRATVVMKLDGASVTDPRGIQATARRLVGVTSGGARVVCVVSAAEETVEELVRLAYAVSDRPDGRELDLLRSAAERIACALLAMAVHDLGREAISLTGSQAGIITDRVYGRAAIVDVRPRRVQAALARGAIVLVAGLQGVSGEAGDITTLGPGGADVTAVALAAALGAERCELDPAGAGLYTADARLVPDARPIAALSYEELLELAAVGACPVALRSIELARKHGVVLHVRSALADDAATVIAEEARPRMESTLVSAIAHTDEEAVYRVQGAAPAELFARLAEDGVAVDGILQTGPEAIVFSAPVSERARTAASLDGLGAAWAEYGELGKVTLVGAGMQRRPGAAARTFATVAELGVQPRFISASSIRLAFYVPREETPSVVRALHAAFALGEGEQARG